MVDEPKKAGEAPDEWLLHELLGELHAAALTDLPAIGDRCASAIGCDSMVVYLADLQQRKLLPLTPGMTPFDVDSSTAGLSYRQLSLRVEETRNGGLTVFLPLVDGADRLGVVGIRTESLDAERLHRARMAASVLAPVIASKRNYSDSFALHSRTELMRLPAEMLRALLPPRTIANLHALSTAAMEPAYEVGGDAFDHSITESTLYTAVVDSVGHDLSAGLTTSLVVAGCRNARRAHIDLPQMVDAIDRALAEWLPGKHCTGIFAQLQMTDGLFRWINCGHPHPLLIRDQHVVDGAFDRAAQVPMGMHDLADGPREAYEAVLDPGDRVLFYTDGITEGRDGGGEEYGLPRLADTIIRGTAAGESAPEALRRLIQSVLEHQNHRLRDDATLLLIEWRSPTS